MTTKNNDTAPTTEASMDAVAGGNRRGNRRPKVRKFDLNMFNVSKERDEISLNFNRNLELYVDASGRRC